MVIAIMGWISISRWLEDVAFQVFDFQMLIMEIMEIMEISNRKLRQFGFWIIHWDQSGFRGQLIFFQKASSKTGWTMV